MHQLLSATDLTVEQVRVRATARVRVRVRVTVRSVAESSWCMPRIPC